MFGECSTAVLKPLSDHKLVNFMVTNPAVVQGGMTEADQLSIPEIAQFNFRKGAEEVLKKCINETDWKEVLKVSPTEGVEKLSEKFIKEMIKVARKAKVPKFAIGIKELTKSKKLLISLEKRMGLERQINLPDCRDKDKEEKETQIEELNEVIQKEHQEQRERKEREALEKIKTNSKEFFKFANKQRI